MRYIVLLAITLSACDIAGPPAPGTTPIKLCWVNGSVRLCPKLAPKPPPKPEQPEEEPDCKNPEWPC